MRVGIVGSGIAALVVAHQIRAAGGQPILVDKASRIGGRLARTRFCGRVIPTGATSCAWTDEAARRAFAATLGVTLAGDRTDFGPVIWDALDRLNTEVVRQRALVTRIAPDDQGCRLHIWGNPDGLGVDAVVVTAPVPQAVQLLTRSGLPHRLTATYESRIVLLAAVAEDPVDELSGPWQYRRQDPGLLMVHPADPWGSELMGQDQTHVQALLLEELHATYPGVTVTDSQLKIWRYAHAVETCDRDPGTAVTDAPIWTCGDGVGGPAGPEYGVQRAVSSALAVSAAVLRR